MTDDAEKKKSADVRNALQPIVVLINLARQGGSDELREVADDADEGVRRILKLTDPR